MSGSEEDKGGTASAAQKTATAVRVGMAAAGGLGCLGSPVVLIVGISALVVIGGLGVILYPLIALILLFGGGGGGGGGSSAGPEDADEAIAVFDGDGKGELATETVPEDLADAIEDAGSICDAIGPTVIAAQLERESNFNKDLVGPDGSKGIAQLTDAQFAEFGEDADDDDKTSVFDPDDAIKAQGKRLCSLADQTRRLVDDGQAVGRVLDLTLVAYDVGVDAVREAKGIPTDNRSQGYVMSIRALLAKYQGVGGAVPPSAYPSPPGSAIPQAPDDEKGQ